MWVNGDNPFYGGGHYVNKPVSKTMTLKVTVYQGGRTLKTMKSSKFSRLLKINVREGAMMELMPDQLSFLIGVENDRNE